MSKNPPRGNEAPAADGTKAPATAEWAVKLQPLEEFRDRADSWMKEITAQVARLAGRSEEEERRKKALDKRLADIEERMQSLLTLTEMVSLSKNPFAAPSAEAPPETPRPAPGGTPAPAAAKTAAPAPEPAPQRPVAAPQPAPPADDAPHARTSSLALSDEDGPAVPARAPLQAPRPVHRSHPNDASADSAPRHHFAAPPPAAPSRSTVPSRDGATGSARERFLILEWAGLIAPSAHRIDLGAFLGFYVESGWIEPNVAAMVRNLTLQLRRDGSGPSGPAPTLEELHARSIVLVSQLAGEDAPLDRAQSAYAEARAAASGAWITART